MSRRIGIRWIRNPGGAPSSEAADASGRDPDPVEPPADPLTGDPFGDIDPVPAPTLTSGERRDAEEEARHGIPTPDALAPSPGERRVTGRFLAAMGEIRSRAETALGRLTAARDGALAGSARVEAAAEGERGRIASLSAAAPRLQRIETRFHRADAARRELDGFRERLGLPDYATPRASSRSWIWLLLAVAVAETTANGLLLHSASTEGVLANWGFAALVTGMNVGLLGWLFGDLICRRMLHATPLRRGLLAAALVPCLALATLLHFGFAHYRDAVQVLDASRAAAVLNLDDIDAGAAADGLDPDPQPPPPQLTVEQAVFNELRAQFLWWRPGASFPVPDGGVREVPAGSVGYAAEDGVLVLREDPLAGRFEGWRSVLLLAVGFVALLLSAWKWFGGAEPIPHFARIHRRAEAASEEFESEVSEAFAWVEREERRHRQRLADGEQRLAAVSGRLSALYGRMRETIVREEHLLRRTAAASESAVEDYREINRRQRLSRDAPPRFWRRLAPLEIPERGRSLPEQWDRQHAHDLGAAGEAAARLRHANAMHAPRAASVFAGLRERIAQAARLPADRGWSEPPPGPAPDRTRAVAERGDTEQDEGVHLVTTEPDIPRIKAAS